MYYPLYFQALSLLLMLHPKVEGSSDLIRTLRQQQQRRSPLSDRPWKSFSNEELDVSQGWRFADPTKQTEKQLFHPSVPIRMRESSKKLQHLASQATKILDRISKKWALEGAKAIQNGEINLRKLHKDLTGKMDNVIGNRSRRDEHILRCLNETIFDAGLYEILDDITDCYARSLEDIEKELLMIEQQESGTLKKMETYAKSIFDTLKGCFNNSGSAEVIDCLQRVENIDMENEMKKRQATELVTEIKRVIEDLPRTFTECTTRGLTETEAFIRKAYMLSLTCLKERDGH